MRECPWGEKKDRELGRGKKRGISFCEHLVGCWLERGCCGMGGIHDAAARARWGKRRGAPASDSGPKKETETREERKRVDSHINTNDQQKTNKT